MDLPRTERGNKHVLVFQDYFSKWPLVFPMPDQKTIRIVQLLVEEVIPLFGVPEALLSDRGTNLLSHLMRDVCDLLGVEKLNTTAYHPQCNGLTERFNRTLKTMLRKHAARFGAQWDRYLSGALWAYRNTPHDSTREKPSFLLFGFDCRSPTEAALLPETPIGPTDVSDYREELIVNLSSARELAVEALQVARGKYKKQYDQRATPGSHKIGDWVLIKFPQEESGAQRKLSRPWHGPYRVLAVSETGVTASKVYFPDHSPIQVHLSRVTPCPSGFPSGHYWYGDRRSGPGRPPKWIDRLLDPGDHDSAKDAAATDHSPDPDPDDGDSGDLVCPLDDSAATPEPELSPVQDPDEQESPTVDAESTEEVQTHARQRRRCGTPQAPGARRSRTRTIVPPARLM